MSIYTANTINFDLTDLGFTLVGEYGHGREYGYIYKFKKTIEIETEDDLITREITISIMPAREEMTVSDSFKPGSQYIFHAKSDHVFEGKMPENQVEADVLFKLLKVN